MDTTAFMIANALVGNDLSSPCLEISFPGPALEFTKDAVIAVCGGDFSPRIDGMERCNWSPLQIAKGSTLDFSALRFGRFAYVSVSGGLNVKQVLGSSSSTPSISTDLGFPAKLKAGDEIRFNPRFTGVVANRTASYSIRPRYSKTPTIRITKGPEWDALSEESQLRLEHTDFTVSNASNRMGFRLKADIGQRDSIRQMLSSPVTCGTIQLPPDGNPIVLMADHQTTGGYPRIGNVVATDIPLLAQMQPRQRIGFKIVDESHARELLMERYKDLAMLSVACLTNLR
jgi:antagonist of KipI